jgi:amino acid transporter
LEDAVNSGGVLLCLIGLLLLPFVWAIPQSLMTAELSTMMPVNGGSIVWVWRALGDTAGVVNAYCSLATSIIDICLYPNLIIAYAPFKLGFISSWLLKTIILLIISIFNVLGLDVVGLVSILLVAMSLVSVLQL